MKIAAKESLTLQFNCFFYQPVPSMCFEAVEKDRYMGTCFRYLKSFSELYYILTKNIVVPLTYTVGGIDDDTDIKMFFARFWRRRLWSRIFEETLSINTQWKEDTILRRKKTYNKETVVVRSSKTIMEGRARRWQESDCFPLIIENIVKVIRDRKTVIWRAGFNRVIIYNP